MSRVARAAFALGVSGVAVGALLAPGIPTVAVVVAVPNLAAASVVVADVVVARRRRTTEPSP